eukprot:COSAG02_NODE_2083_length_9893_cov_3.131815_8_plen_524_part_00
MRRLSEGKLVQESPMEARLREFKAQQAVGGDQTVPKAAGAQHQSMMEIPQSPIFGADGPQPKGSLPKQSASYSYNPTSGIGGSNSTVNEATELPGKLASPGGPNRNVTAYKSMALASYQSEKKKAVLERNLSRRQADSDSSDDASAQTDSEDEALQARVRARGNASPTARSQRSHKSGASSARSKGAASSAHASSRSRASAAIPGRSPGRATGDDSSSVGSTTSESEEEEMTATEKMDMMSAHRSGSAHKEVLMIGDKKHRHKGKRHRHQDDKSLVNTSLYVAAKQPPWVEAALAEQAALEYSESEYDSSEDERDRTREGRGGKDSEFGLMKACCSLIFRKCRRLVSKPDTIQRELPPDREWERAEKALSSATGSSIKKTWKNLWGRCTPKRLTHPVQLRLVCFGLTITDKSKPTKQLAPQLIGAALVMAHVFYAAIGADNTGRRLFGERNYMLFTYTVRSSNPCGLRVAARHVPMSYPAPRAAGGLLVYHPVHLRAPPRVSSRSPSCKLRRSHLAGVERWCP